LKNLNAQVVLEISINGYNLCKIGILTWFMKHVTKIGSLYELCRDLMFHSQTIYAIYFWKIINKCFLQCFTLCLYNENQFLIHFRTENSKNFASHPITINSLKVNVTNIKSINARNFSQIFLIKSFSFKKHLFKVTMNFYAKKIWLN